MAEVAILRGIVCAAGDDDDEGAVGGHFEGAMMRYWETPTYWVAAYIY